jgi:hypothetical protein
MLKGVLTRLGGKTALAYVKPYYIAFIMSIIHYDRTNARARGETICFL